MTSATGGTSQRRGAKTFFVASGVAQVFALARYALLARIVGPEQLGLAATLILTSQFFEALTDNGSDRFLIQDRDGDTQQVQQLVQFVFVLRGLAIAAALFVFSRLLAGFYSAPPLTVGFMTLAVSPLIFGFLHLDLRRAQRRNDFLPESIVVLAAETSTLAVTVVAALLTRNFTAVLYGLITRSFVMVMVSHLLAKRPYRLGFSRSVGARLARFASPLLLNGPLIFFGSQGDRVLIANHLGVTELGRYSAALMLVYYPVVMLSRSLSALQLSHLAGFRDHPADQSRAIDAISGQTLLIAVAMCVGFSSFTPIGITLLYGRKFEQSAVLTSLIAVLLCSRFSRIWISSAALAVGKTSCILAGNLIRLAAFPAALGLIAIGGGLQGVVIGFIVGELVATAAGMLLLNRAIGRGPLDGFDRLAVWIAAGAVIIEAVAVVGRPSVAGAALVLIAAPVIVAILARRERATLSQAFAVARTALRRPLWIA